MKKLSVICLAILATGLSLTSCSSDEVINKTGDPAIAAQQNATESNKINVESLEQGVLINGATKKTGNPPAPNSNIDFQLNTNETTALQNKGVNIKFSSTSDIAGAYIRFKDVDGNGATSYFDVPSVAFGNRIAGKSLLKNKLRTLGAKKVDDTSIDVDFTNVIPAGEFCYDICIYDSANNISAIQTVCVTVEAWGGNADLVGNWVYIGSSEDNIEESLDCNNGGTINVLYNKVISRDINLSFNEDGSYKDHGKQESFDLDWDQSINSCTPVYNNESDKHEFKRTGNWAFNQRDNKLSIVMFKYQDVLNPAESFEKENGELITDALTIKELTADSLIIEEEVDFGGASIESITYTFKRK